MLRVGRWWLAGAAIVLVVIAAGATPESFGGFLPTEGPGRVVLPEGLPIHRYLLAVLAVLALTVFVAAQIVARREGIAPPPRRSSWRMVAGLLVLVVVVNLVPVIRDRLDAWFDSGNRATEQRAPPGDPDEALRREPSRLLGYAVAGVMALFAALMVAVLWILLGRDGARRGRSDPDADLEAAIEAGLLDLADVTEPRAAVLAAYARLQRAADAAGIRRRSSDVPFELLALLTADGRMEPEAARRLTELFELARFSPHAIDESMRAEAIACLGAVRERLATPA